MRLPPLLLAALLPLAPSQAQTQTSLAPRVDKLEKEMHAVQRKVFPGGAPGYFEPEIAPAATAPESAGNPATSPVADLTARVGSLEEELRRLTGQAEQNGNRLNQLEQELARFKGQAGSRLDLLEGRAPAADPAAGDTRRPAQPVSTNGTDPAARAAAPAVDAAPAPTGDPAEDAYLAGYRLWSDRRYPEAEAALKAVVAKYPKSRRASYAQNLLGRAYLDEGKPAAAALAFHANYTTMPKGERAPDSLYFLGQALMKLDRPAPAKACEAYAALTRDYGATIGQTLKDRVAQARTEAKCGS